MPRFTREQARLVIAEWRSQMTRAELALAPAAPNASRPTIAAFLTGFPLGTITCAR